MAAHATRIELSEPAPAEVAVGAGFAVKVGAACAAGCDLGGMPVEVTGPDGAVVTAKLVSGDDAVSETGEIALTAPRTVGEHLWRVALPAHRDGDVAHGHSELQFSVRTKPLATSLAVWDIPSPVAMSERFTIKVGAKSSGDCGLAGRAVEICDATGAVVGRGNLGETPWPGTSALYWTEVELLAPPNEGLVSWSVQFAAAGLELPHDRSVSSFSLAVVRAPKHRLTVKVVAKETAAPIEDAQVRLGPFRAATDATGRAEVRLPSDTYDVFIWKVGYEAPATTVEVNGDVAVEVQVVTLPAEDPDALWTM